MSNLVPFSDIEKMGKALAVSGLFGIKTVEQAIALMLVAQSEGLHPATAALEYDVIEGRPALKSGAMLARFLKAGGKVDWLEHNDNRVAATFSHPSGGSITVDWDMRRAEQAGLNRKRNYMTYPRQMLRARCISEGVRAVYPVATGGMYVPEEVQDFGSLKDAKPVIETEPDLTLDEAIQALVDHGNTEGFPELMKSLAPRIPRQDVEELKVKAREVWTKIKESERANQILGAGNE